MFDQHKSLQVSRSWLFSLSYQTFIWNVRQPYLFLHLSEMSSWKRHMMGCQKSPHSQVPSATSLMCKGERDKFWTQWCPVRYLLQLDVTDEMWGKDAEWPWSVFWVPFLSLRSQVYMLSIRGKCQGIWHYLLWNKSPQECCMPCQCWKQGMYCSTQASSISSLKRMLAAFSWESGFWASQARGGALEPAALRLPGEHQGRSQWGRGAAASIEFLRSQKIVPLKILHLRQLLPWPLPCYISEFPRTWSVDPSHGFSDHILKIF